MFGIDVACKQLFNQEPDDINIENAAVLVGMLKATGVYSPLRNEDRAADRQYCPQTNGTQPVPDPA